MPSSSVPPQPPLQVIPEHGQLPGSHAPPQLFTPHAQEPGSSNGFSQLISNNDFSHQVPVSIAPTPGPEHDLDDSASRLISIGDFVVVLGDTFEGYYLVKCLSTTVDSFSGKYFELSQENVKDKVILEKL